MVELHLNFQWRSVLVRNIGKWNKMAAIYYVLFSNGTDYSKTEALEIGFKEGKIRAQIQQIRISTKYLN